MSGAWTHRVGTPEPDHMISAQRMINFLQAVLDEAHEPDILLECPGGFWLTYSSDNQRPVTP
jgi:hypothetical protein